ncbi:MAG: YggT family protein [Alphaproteobacteria bacterium]|nr:YggT family protein [Alphaproteobacteria bacterium]MDE2630255.1 YggT family protein [Alphaproteobacteria bacterium]
MSIFGPILWLAQQIVWLFLIVMFVRVVLSWLFLFDVVNRRHPVAYQINDFTERLTEPVIRPFRRFIPAVGGFDLAFILVFLLCYVVQMYLAQLGQVLP